MELELDCSEFIHGKLLRNGADLKGYTNVAWSANFDPTLTEGAQRAVFLGAENKLTAFHGAFALGQTGLSVGEWSVLTRFLWSGKGDQMRGVVLCGHYLLLRRDGLQRLGYNFRPLADYFLGKYGDTIPAYTNYEELSGRIRVSVLPEAERLASLWDQLQGDLASKPQFLPAIWQALFEPVGVMLLNFPRTDSPHDDEKKALDLTELLTLLLPRSLRLGMTFATRLFRPAQSPAKLKFDAEDGNDVRVDWQTGRLVYPGSRSKSSTPSLWYADDVFTLLEAERFDELAYCIGQLQLDSENLRLSEPAHAYQVYLAWERVSEKDFLPERLEKGTVTPERWIALLERGQLREPAHVAQGLALLTKMMITKGKYVKYQSLIPSHINAANAGLYAKRIQIDVLSYPHTSQALFAEWSRAPAFWDQLACRELTGALVDVLAGELNGISQAMDFVDRAGELTARSILLQACARHASDVDSVKHLFTRTFWLAGLTSTDLRALQDAPGLDALPQTRRLLNALLGDEPATDPDTPLLRECYRQEWGRDRHLLIGAIAAIRAVQCLELLISAVKSIGWALTLEGLKSMSQETKYREILEWLWSNSRSLVPSSDSTFHDACNNLALALENIQNAIDSLKNDIPAEGVRQSWFQLLEFLIAQESDQARTAELLREISNSSNWTERRTEVCIRDCLRIADRLQWDQIAYPLIEQAGQLVATPTPEVDAVGFMRLFAWFRDNQPENDTVLDGLRVRACRNTLAGKARWSDVAPLLLSSPPKSIDLEWLKGTLRALDALNWYECAQIMNRCQLWMRASDRKNEQAKNLFDEAVSKVHMRMLLAMLESPDTEYRYPAHLPELGSPHLVDRFVEVLQEAFFDVPCRGTEILAGWCELNWLTQELSGQAFLETLVRKANEESFCPAGLILVEQIADLEDRRHLLEVCAGRIQNRTDAQDFVRISLAPDNLEQADFAAIQLGSRWLPATQAVLTALSQSEIPDPLPSLMQSWVEMGNDLSYLLAASWYAQSLGKSMLVNDQVIHTLVSYAKQRSDECEPYRDRLKLIIESWITPASFSNMEASGQHAVLWLAAKYDSSSAMLARLVSYYLSSKPWCTYLHELLSQVPMTQIQQDRLVHSLFEFDPMKDLDEKAAIGYYWHLVKATPYLRAMAMDKQAVDHNLQLAGSHLAALLSSTTSSDALPSCSLVEELAMTTGIVDEALWSATLPYELMRASQTDDWECQGSSFHNLVRIVAQYVYATKNSVPIATLADPTCERVAPYIAFQACYVLWRELQALSRRDQRRARSLRSKLTTLHRSVSLDSELDQKNINIKLREVWIDSMEVMHTKYRQVEQQLGDVAQDRSIAVFLRASEAFGSLFNNPQDLNELVLLVLKLILLRSPQGQIDRNIGLFWRKYENWIIKKARSKRDLSSLFGDLLFNACWDLLRKGDIKSTHLRAADSFVPVGQEYSHQIIQEALAYWKAEQECQALQVLLETLRAVELPNLSGRYVEEYLDYYLTHECQPEEAERFVRECTRLTKLLGPLHELAQK